MKTNKNVLFKTIKTFAIIVAITFSTNMSATTTNFNLTPLTSNVSALSTNNITASANVHALTFNWGWIKDLFKALCKKCGRKCGGKCGNPDGGGQGGNPDSIPLDGGLGILMLGAAAFGAKKLRDNKKRKF